MDELERIFAENRAAWDARVPVHVGSRLYDVEAFKRGASSLQALERRLVGDVRGKSLLHLMCHFGLDTLSWQRLGARATGVDFSPRAIETARGLAKELGLDARFVESNVLRTREQVKERFDLVFSSYGVIGWLPDLEPWGRVIAESLEPGGRFVLAEFHPYVWMSQMGPDLAIRYPYFNRGVITEEITGTYADREAPLRMREHGWNHSLAEVINALIDAGLRIERLEELDSTPYDIFPGLVRGEDGRVPLRSGAGDGAHHLRGRGHRTRALSAAPHSLLVAATLPAGLSQSASLRGAVLVGRQVGGGDGLRCRSAR